MDSRGKIAWVVPYPVKGSGGFRTIVHNVAALQAAGYSCEFFFASTDHNRIESLYTLSKNIFDWFGGIPDACHFAFEINSTGEYDLCIATSWDTVQWAISANAKVRAYFVQDYEPCFYEMGANRIEAERSYTFDLHPITIGYWLAKTMQDKYAKPAYVTKFGADNHIYEPLGRERKRAVCAIYQPEKPRRLSKTLEESIKILTVLDPDIEVYLYGSESPFPFSCNRVHNLGIISVQECNTLYNTCMCGISLSCSNPSRIPFEMMACGLPVIELNRENNYYDFADKTLLLCEPTAGSLASAVLQIVDSPQMQKSLSHNGMRFIETRAINKEAEDFVNACIRIIKGDEPSYMELQKHTQFVASNKQQTEDMLINIRFQEARTLAEESTPAYICNGNAKVTVYAKSLSKNEGIKAAVWSKENQKDLKWITPINVEGAFEFIIPFGESEDEQIIANLHFYIGNDIKTGPFLFGIRQLFSSNHCVCLHFTRKIRINSKLFEIDFSNEQYNSTPKSEICPSISLIRKIVNKIKEQ